MKIRIIFKITVKDNSEGFPLNCSPDSPAKPVDFLLCIIVVDRGADEVCESPGAHIEKSGCLS